MSKMRLNLTFVDFLDVMNTKNLLFLLVFFSFSATAQYKNSVRTNLTTLPVSLYSLQYEHAFGNHIALNNTFFYRPKLQIPFGEPLDKLAKTHGVGLTGIRFDYIFMNKAHVGVKGYSPELKFYLTKSAHRPFISLFGMYEHFDMRVPALINVRNLDVEVPINFTFQTLSGGILIGYQFRWDRIGLDFVLIGPHIGRADNFYAQGKNSAIQGLSEREKIRLKAGIKERFGLSEKYFDLKITDNSAEIVSIRQVPYFGLRGLGLNLSFMF